VADCYLSIGSNTERDKYIPAGLHSLKQTFGQLTLSSIYESVSVGFLGEAFYNLVAHFKSDLSAKEIMLLLRQLEYQYGRPMNSQKFSARTLDLDLLLYDDLIDAELKLPRVDITHYAFVLEPLAEIAPHLIHPVLKINYAQLWQDFNKEPIQQQRVIPPWLHEICCLYDAVKIK
jgi:2-amino-4-hydroxy-6-hydroxymethyldihydropteridine diphosphokinase